jgi:hypothetical protein
MYANAPNDILGCNFFIRDSALASPSQRIFWKLVFSLNFHKNEYLPNSVLNAYREVKSPEREVCRSQNYCISVFVPLNEVAV